MNRTISETDYFLACYWRILRSNMYIGKTKMPMGINNWDIEIYRNQLEKKVAWKQDCHFPVSNNIRSVGYHIAEPSELDGHWCPQPKENK